MTLGRNHMWIDYDDKSDRIILIDKENPIFSGNSKLTKKNHRYTITFSPQDAEKYPNSHDHVYYFSKNNHKFSLVPISTSPPNNPNNKKESKFEYRIFFEEGNSGYYSFQNVFPDIPKEEWKIIHINQDHPQIKELVSQGKLEKHKLFTIRYGKADEESNDGLIVTFNEFSEGLEIMEV